MSTAHTRRDHQIKSLFYLLSKEIKRNSLSTLESMVDTNAIDVSQIKSTKNSTLLHVAAKYNREEIAAYLIQKGLSIHEQNSRSECPYYIAVLRKSREVLEYMEKHVE